MFSLLAPVQAQAIDVAATTLRPGATGRYLVNGRNEPFFWQGDTEWELFRALSTDDARALLRARKSQGFNVVQVMVMGVFPEWAKETGTTPWQGAQAWLNGDPTKPDEDYFQRVDAIVSAAQEYGIVLVIGVYHARDSDAGRLTAASAREWGRWLGHRYRQAPNIVWSMFPHAVPASVPMIRATIEGLQAGDGGTHLITLHPDPSPTSSSFLHTEPWLSFNTLQTWSSGHSNYAMVRTDYARQPAKPVVDGEARYEEEDGTTPLQIRRGAWWAGLAGGFYSYGHRDNWKSATTWASWIETPGAHQTQIAGDLLRSLDWWNLVPDQTLFVGEPGDNAAAHSSSGSWMVAYLPAGGSVQLRLAAIMAPEATACWIDPRTGARTRIGLFPTRAPATFTTPAGWEDAVLLIERK